VWQDAAALFSGDDHVSSGETIGNIATPVLTAQPLRAARQVKPVTDSDGYSAPSGSMRKAGIKA
jgi:hypothetical protein